MMCTTVGAIPCGRPKTNVPHERCGYGYTSAMLRLPSGGSSRVAGEGERENKRSTQTIRLRMNEQYAPISICYMPTNGAFVNATYKWSEVPAPSQRLPTHIRFKITIRPWRIISRFPLGKHITFSLENISRAPRAHITVPQALSLLICPDS